MPRVLIQEVIGVSEEAEAGGNAYVVAAGRTYLLPGGSWLEVEEGMVVVRRGARGRPIAAVALSPGTLVAIGTGPPIELEPTPAAGGWPPEPPPDVDEVGNRTNEG
ncbi:MAG TPA: hypothetical protein VFD01_12380 [Candidatus Dormibacteraeota bacterium]|jgi:hypothetical protein|nr:hypothetical protein [Candidatus Dormibacteraeota bacterium]